LQEAYVLVHHTGFSLGDIDLMSFHEREFFIKARLKEQEDQEAQINDAKTRKG